MATFKQIHPFIGKVMNQKHIRHLSWMKRFQGRVADNIVTAINAYAVTQSEGGQSPYDQCIDYVNSDQDYYVQHVFTKDKRLLTADGQPQPADAKVAPGEYRLEEKAEEE